MKARLVTIPALAVPARPPGSPQNGNIAPPALPKGGLHGYSALDEWLYSRDKDNSDSDKNKR